MLMKEKEKKVVTEVIWQKKLKTMKINQLKLKIAFQLWFNRIVKKEKNETGQKNDGTVVPKKTIHRRCVANTASLRKYRN